jgi:oligopeptide/dipeptide ABC transporter ATP-binding protein
MSTEQAVLSVQDLHVSYPAKPGPVQVVRGLEFSLAAGEILAVVGESGSGKTQTAMAIMGLLGAGAQLRGEILLQGQRLDQLDAAGWATIRGRRIGLVSQDPAQALNPYRRIGSQMREMLQVHGGIPGDAAMLRIAQALESVGLESPEELVAAYPHQLSGGMQQRVVLATALLAQPAVLVTDEPTTALDVTTQAQVLELLRRLASETGTAILFITHDLGVVAGLADRLLVLYGGRSMELGDGKQILACAGHPYTRGLLACAPRLDSQPGTPLPAMRGQAPGGGQWPRGCPFHPRCPRRVESCSRAVPPMENVGTDHRRACFNPETPI